MSVISRVRTFFTRRNEDQAESTYNQSIHGELYNADDVRRDLAADRRQTSWGILPAPEGGMVDPERPPYSGD